jgi:predicted RNA-binding Zn ribbon-like protein
VDGGRPRADDITLVNSCSIAAPPHAQISHDGRTAVRAAPAPVAGILSIIARDAIALFTGEHHDRIRRCLGHECSLYFVDRSRRGNRRWCSMAACGEKASSAAYRRRNGAATRIGSLDAPRATDTP